MPIFSLRVRSTSLRPKVFDAYPDDMPWSSISLELSSEDMRGGILLEEGAEDLAVVLSIGTSPLGERWILDEEGKEPSKLVGVAQYHSSESGGAPLVVFNIPVGERFMSTLVDFFKAGRSIKSVYLDTTDIEYRFLSPAALGGFDQQDKWDTTVCNRLEIKAFSFDMTID